MPVPNFLCVFVYIVVVSAPRGLISNKHRMLGFRCISLTFVFVFERSFFVEFSKLTINTLCGVIDKFYLKKFCVWSVVIVLCLALLRFV